MDSTIRISMGTSKLGQGNNVPKLSQGSQDTYLMVHIHLLTKKRFNVKQRVGGDVAFARFLIGKR
jgi:hypothetical protein